MLKPNKYWPLSKRTIDFYDGQQCHPPLCWLGGFELGSCQFQKSHLAGLHWKMPELFGGTWPSGYKCFHCFSICLACMPSLWSHHVFLPLFAHKETPGPASLCFSVCSQDRDTRHSFPKSSPCLLSTSCTASPSRQSQNLKNWLSYRGHLGQWT